jgi:hypothetical protein
MKDKNMKPDYTEDTGLNNACLFAIAEKVLSKEGQITSKNTSFELTTQFINIRNVAYSTGYRQGYEDALKGE